MKDKHPGDSVCTVAMNSCENICYINENNTEFRSKLAILNSL